jgi:pyruvate, water dikinase
VVKNVIRVWSSTFNTRSMIARARLGLPLHYDPIGVAVLTMVDAKAAGVMFSINPINGDESKVAIEAGFGFGEAVVSGNVTPRSISCGQGDPGNRREGHIRQGNQFIYNPETKEMEYKELPPDQRKLPCLEDREIIELTKIAKKVEAHFGCPKISSIPVSGSLPFLKASFSSRPDQSRVGQEEKGIRARQKDRF